MAKSYIGPDFTSPLCRISYAFGLHKAKEGKNPGEKAKHSVTLILPKTSLLPVQKAVANVVENEWGEKGVERFKKGLIKNPIIAGDSKSAFDAEGDLRPGMGPDVAMIRPWSLRPVACFSPKVLPMDAKDIQSGWWGHAVLTPFAWHNDEQGDGVGFWISMWQHVKEDEVLGGDGNKDPKAFFERVDTGDDEDVSGGDASDMFG